jgi:cytochrome c2
VTTFDNIINRPGKGSGQPTGVAGDTTNDMWMGWTMWNTGVTSTETKADHFRVNPNCAACHPQEESTRLNIGMGPNFSINEASSVWDDDGQPLSGNGDLTNDHPIGVPYETDGRASLRSTSTTLASLSMAQANTVHGSGTPTAEFGRSDNFWSVFGYIKADATIDDLLRNGGQVECASCHDPHYKNQTNNDPSLINSYNRTGGVTPGGIGYNYTVSGQFDEKIDGLFLRRVGGNSNSGVCRTCHAK